MGMHPATYVFFRCAARCGLTIYELISPLQVPELIPEGWHVDVDTDAIYCQNCRAA